MGVVAAAATESTAACRQLVHCGEAGLRRAADTRLPTRPPDNGPMAACVPAGAAQRAAAGARGGGPGGGAGGVSVGRVGRGRAAGREAAQRLSAQAGGTCALAAASGAHRCRSGCSCSCLEAVERVGGRHRAPDLKEVTVVDVSPAVLARRPSAAGGEQRAARGVLSGAPAAFLEAFAAGLGATQGVCTGAPGGEGVLLAPRPQTQTLGGWRGALFASVAGAGRLASPGPLPPVSQATRLPGVLIHLINTANSSGRALLALRSEPRGWSGLAAMAAAW